MAAPVEKKAQAMVCKGLGIIKDGEEVMEWALAQFASRFQGRIHEDVLSAMLALFKVGTDEDLAIDDAMIAHGGADALDLDRHVDASAAPEA
jgi:hypothetical protein